MILEGSLKGPGTVVVDYDVKKGAMTFVMKR